MNRTEAHQLLDAAVNGVEVSTEAITLALIATGDLCEGRKHRQPDHIHGMSGKTYVRRVMPVLAAEWLDPLLH